MTAITIDHTAEDIEQLYERLDELSAVVDVLRERLPKPKRPIYFDVKIWASEAHMASGLLRDPEQLRRIAPELPLRILPDSIIHESKWLWCHIVYTGPRAEVYPKIYGALLECVTSALEKVGRAESVDVTVEDITLHAEG